MISIFILDCLMWASAMTVVVLVAQTFARGGKRNSAEKPDQIVMRRRETVRMIARSVEIRQGQRARAFEQQVVVSVA